MIEISGFTILLICALINVAAFITYLSRKERARKATEEINTFCKGNDELLVPDPFSKKVNSIRRISNEDGGARRSVLRYCYNCSKSFRLDDVICIDTEKCNPVDFNKGCDKWSNDQRR